jgi:hypothetical protein
VEFTLHVDFQATDEDDAGCRAEVYVQALNLLRPEVDSYRARISAQADWSASVPVFCNAPGPDAMDVCLDRFGHEGRHHGTGPTGWWSEEQIPRAPDTPGDLM